MERLSIWIKRCVTLIGAAAGIWILSARPTAADDQFPDACKLAAARNIGAPITPRHNIDIRSAEPACAFDQMKGLAKTAQPPSLVEDPEDQVLRTDADTVVTRHGSDISVVDAREVRELARRRANWTCRLEAMASTAVGRHFPGPVDARVPASVCRLVARADVLALLSLSPPTLEVSDDPTDHGLRHRFDVRDASREITDWTKNHGSAQLRGEDLGGKAAALARLHAERPFNRPSTLVQTADPTDRVAPSPEHPEEVEVHGPYLMILNIEKPADAARQHRSWSYRVRRTALAATGATIIQPAGTEPDPVASGPAPPTAFSWRTSDHAPPSWSALSDPILHIIAFLARHRFVLAPVLICGSILAGLLGVRHVKMIPVCIGLAVLNVVFGNTISGILIYHLGAEGEATITGSHATAIVYNNQNVRRHDVLLKTADGRIVETGFEDDDFNVYPPHNQTHYPGRGDEFNVRYLQHFPQDFVILGEDDSPWAHDVRCAKLGTSRSQAEQKLKFAPNVLAYRAAFDAAKRAEASAGCVPEAAD